MMSQVESSFWLSHLRKMSGGNRNRTTTTTTATSTTTSSTTSTSTTPTSTTTSSPKNSSRGAGTSNSSNSSSTSRSTSNSGRGEEENNSGVIVQKKQKSGESEESGSGEIESATAIGNTFVLSYYTVLNREPSQLIVFYKENSTLIYASEDSNKSVEQETYRGEECIGNKLSSLDLQGSQVVLSVVDSQHSGEGILILVIGHLVDRQKESRKFVQSFYLAPQTHPGVGYYVRNAVFRYLATEKLNKEHLLSPPHTSTPQQQQQQQQQHLEESTAEVEPLSSQRIATDGESTTEPIVNKAPGDGAEVQEKKEEKTKGEGKGETRTSWASLVSSTATTATTETTPAPGVSGSLKSTTSSTIKTTSHPEVKPSTTKPKRTESHSVFIRNIPLTAKEEQIRAIFPTNDMIRISLFSQKGYCFIDYKNAETVETVIQKSKQSPIVLNDRTLSVERKKYKAAPGATGVEGKKERNQYRDKGRQGKFAKG